MDPPTLPGCRSCVLNDLDLYIKKNGTADGKKYFPNGLDRRDDTNNAERIQIEDVANGDSFKISVNAYNLFTTQQKYAMVATGCFGGSGNLIAGTDVYANDNSKNFLRNLLLGIFIPLGVICLCAGVFAAVKKKREDEAIAAEYGHDPEGDQGIYGGPQSDEGYGD